MTYNNSFNSLGVLGLLPFVFGIVLTLIETDFLGINGVDIFTSYSLAILCFLSGSLWGQILKDEFFDRNKKALVMTNVLVVAGWSASLASETFSIISLIVLGLAFCGILLLEIFLFRQSVVSLNRDYARLRFTLTALVLSGHVGMVVIHA
jgi:hypothetical protein